MGTQIDSSKEAGLKILILSCSCGGGHDSAGRAVRDEFLREGDECEFRDVLSFFSRHYSKLICNSYVELVKTAPDIFGKVYETNENRYKECYAKKSMSFSYIAQLPYANKLQKFITEEKFDAVICTHLFGGQVLTHLRRHGKLSVPFYFVSTDYSCAPLLEEVEADMIFVPHKDCIPSFTVRGIDEKKLFVCGIPVAEKFKRRTEKSEARKQLSLPVDSSIVLIMSGSMGFGNPVAQIKEILARVGGNVMVILITGKNKRLFSKASKAFRRNEDVLTVGFTDKVDLFMDASDVILSKPGGLSSTEALVKNIPIVHTNPIPGCETENADFFRSHGMSLVSSDVGEIAGMTARIVTDQGLRGEMMDAQRKNSFPDTARQIVSFVKKQRRKAGTEPEENHV